MPSATLSADFLKNVSIPEKGKVDYYDNAAVIGFVAEIRCTGGITYYLRYRDTHGKQRQHKIGDAASISFDKAKQTAIVLRSRVVLGEDPSQERKAKRLIPTLAEFAAERYMPFVKGYKKSWDSDDSYLRHHLLPKFGALHLDEVKQDAVIAFHHGMRAKYALSTCNRMLILLRYIYNLGNKWKVPGAETNPTAGVQLYECNNARERFLNLEETQRLRIAIDNSDNTQLKFIVPMLLLSGMRKQELFRSEWKNVDMERRTWKIPTTKTGKARHVPISLALLAILQSLPRWKDCPYVVPNPKTKLPFVSVYNSWNTARVAAGLGEVRMHDLRHSMASNMVNSGRSIYEVAKVLGHTQIKTSQRYSHLSQETLLAAVDASANAAGSNWGAAPTAKTGDNLAQAPA